MLQKDKFITKSSKSSTNSASLGGLDTPIQFVKGVGPKLGAVFNSREIKTVRDLIYFFPRSYEDRTQVQTVSTLQSESKATVRVKVISHRLIPVQKLGRSILDVRVEDETGDFSLKWFHAPRGMERRFVPGTPLTVTGKVKVFKGRAEMVHPEISWSATPEEEVGDSIHEGRIIPIYTELEGVPSRTFRKVLWEALDKFGSTLEEDLPLFLLERHSIPHLREAVRALHFPPQLPGYDLPALAEFRTPAHQRLIYGEFFKFQFILMQRKREWATVLSKSFGNKGGVDLARDLARKLPFSLTAGQGQVLREILSDLSQTRPMNRLVQGDVGAGKTIVALLAAATILAEGGQAVLMVPTEILAEQHFKNATKVFGDPLKVFLLTGRTSSSARNQIQKELSNSTPLLLIGTHALIEEPVVFSCLSLVIIDEQHRFGVEQRAKLKEKGVSFQPESGHTLMPHTLVLTATPIPRTLAMTAFGDLAVSSIRGLPAGRLPVQTQVVNEGNDRAKVYARIKEQLAQGRQAYFIYPLVNESEAEGFTQLKSAVAEAEFLANEAFPEYSVGLLHGQMSSEEKEKIMSRFKAGEIRILVSTTVIEVGVDVPNATVMAIEHAERFGLSQLHQLRGRVGRGQHQSFCFLFSTVKGSETTQQRLHIMEKTQDGFKIAEADLEIRGPGEFLGTRQAGALPFKVANLVRDSHLLERAKEDALSMIDTDPELQNPQHGSLKKYFAANGSLMDG